MTTVQAKRNFFYDNIEVTDIGSFPNKHQIDFGFQASRVIIINDAPEDTLTFSFRNPHMDGELFCDDGPLTFDGLGQGYMWLHYGTAPAKVRIWAWRA